MGKYVHFTPEKKKKFLEAFAEHWTVTDACKIVGISQKNAYNARHKDEEFAAGWKAVEESIGDMLEKEAIKRGLAKSDTLLIFLLKGNKPDKYKDRIDTNVSADIRVEIMRFGEDKTTE